MSLQNSYSFSLQTRLVSTSRPGRAWDDHREIEFELYRKYQMAVHNDPPDRCTVHGFTRFLVNTPLKVRSPSQTKHNRKNQSRAKNNYFEKKFWRSLKPGHFLQITLEQMHRKHRLFKLSADLFAKYQMAVHNENRTECDEKQFYDFLVDTPLKVLCSALDAILSPFAQSLFFCFSKRKVTVLATDPSTSSIGWMIN